MFIGSERITKVLDFKDHPVGPEILGKLASQLEGLFQSPSVVTLNRIGSNYPYWRFVIAGNSSQNKQIAVEMDSRLESKLQVPPVRLMIRLLERDRRRLTRAIFSLLSTGRVSNDFNRVEDLTENKLRALDSENTLEIDPKEPAWYEPAFLEEVLNALVEVTVNAELLQKVLNYYNTKHIPTYYPIEQ